MKKLIVLTLLLVLITGCGEKESNDNKVYSFTYNNMNFILGQEFDKSKYGTEISYSEVPSCAGLGVDKTYTYEHYEVTTTPNGDKDMIYNIYLSDDSVKTNEGIKIGDSLEALTKAYGDNYEKRDNAYTYTLDNTHLEFIVEGDIVSSITYYIDVEQSYALFFIMKKRLKLYS